MMRYEHFFPRSLQIPSEEVSLLTPICPNIEKKLLNNWLTYSIKKKKLYCLVLFYFRPAKSDNPALKVERISFAICTSSEFFFSRGTSCMYASNNTTNDEVVLV